MIEVHGVSKRFVQGRGKKARQVQAVTEANFSAADGVITGLLGPNGAGKTTLVRMIAGLIPPDRGRIEVGGMDVAAQPVAARTCMGVLSDARGLYPRLTAEENIVYYGKLHGMSAHDARVRAGELARLLEMEELLGRRTEGFSQGERMKTALARILLHDPSNIILDEPTNGLDVVATRGLRGLLRKLRTEGKCILLSTHIMQEVERLCDTVLVMSRGSIVARGTVPQLLAQTASADFEDAFVDLAFPPNQEVTSTAHGIKP
ncbi:MAG: ATP-binding cassette domain-containing protein [Betaproteobacteria bacterium]|nr:ATP-binding cassette domain-containing protein [Betaproteobacteria bacterium]